MNFYITFWSTITLHTWIQVLMSSFVKQRAPPVAKLPSVTSPSLPSINTPHSWQSPKPLAAFLSRSSNFYKHREGLGPHGHHWYRGREDEADSSKIKWDQQWIPQRFSKGEFKIHHEFWAEGLSWVWTWFGWYYGSLLQAFRKQQKKLQRGWCGT